MGNYIGKVCPLCHADIMEGDAITVCSVCGVPHHESCWENNHGCANCECMKQQENVQHTIPVCACRNCGTLLEDDQMFCPRCGTPKDAVENKVCKKCGADLQEGQAFCVKCGQKVELIKEQNTASLLSQMNTVSKQSVKSMDVMIYSFICILGSVLLFVDGFFTYHRYFKLIHSDSSYRQGSFLYLLKGVPLDFGTIFWVVIIGALSVIFVFEWIGLFKNKRIKVVNIVCSSIALGATLLGSIIGALTFYNLYSQYFGLLGETLTSENSFTSFSVLFYVELVLMIVLLVLSILSDKGTIFLKQRRSVHADDRKIKP